MGIAVFFLVRAVIRGFVRELMGLIGVVVAIVVSEMTFQPLSGLLSRLTGMQANWWDAVAFAIILFLVFSLFLYLGRGLSRLIHSGAFGVVDRLLGAVVGTAKGILLAYLFLSLLLLIRPSNLPPILAKSYLAPYVLKAGNMVVEMVPEDLTRTIQERSKLFQDMLKSQMESGSGESR